MRCNGITSGGERCKLEATHGSYCWSHAPETADERRQRAKRGGKTGGRGRGGSEARELQDLKRGISDVIDGVLDGSQDRGRAAVAIQGFNALRGVLELERKIKETADLEARIEALERSQEHRGGRGWRGA